MAKSTTAEATTEEQEKPKLSEQAAVVPAKQAASNLPAVVDDDLAAEMAAARGDAQGFEAEQLKIPRIKLLQDLNPETKRRDPAYIEGAEPGFILNSLIRTIDEKIEFVPAKFMVRYIAWRPRKDGGGLVDMDLTREECDENFTSDGLGKWVGAMTPRNGEEPVKVEIIQTPEWVGYAKSASFDWMPVAISFPGTKNQTVRDINTTINLTKMTDDKGEFTPAAYFHLFELNSFLVPGDLPYYNFGQKHLGWCREKKVRDDAKKLKHSLERGDTVVEDIDTQT